MTVVTPPLYLNVDSEYTAAGLGLPYRDIIAEGVVGSTAMAVSQRGAGANLSVDVAAGVAWVKGDESALQPTYRCYNDATVNLAIAAADGSNPRIDRVIAEVRDSAFAGVSTDWRLRVITGTPSSGATLTNLTGAGAVPNNALLLANVSVPTSDTTISDAQIANVATLASVNGSLSPAYVTALPATPYDGQEVYYGADPTNGVIWHLRYRSAASGSYKWEFIGGDRMRATQSPTATENTTSSASYGAGSGATLPSITLPLAGDYNIMWEGLSQNDTIPWWCIYHPFQTTNLIPSDDTSIRFEQQVAAKWAHGHAERRFNGLAAAAVTLQMRIAGAGTAKLINSHLAIRPIRVG